MTYCTTCIKIFGVTWRNKISLTITNVTVSTIYPSHTHYYASTLKYTTDGCDPC